MSSIPPGFPTPTTPSIARPAARIEYGSLVALVDALMPDPAARRALARETPRRLFGFA